jgi:hypothetical protein
MKVTNFELAVEGVSANGKAVPRDASRNCVITGMAVGRNSSVGTGMAVGRDSSVGIATRYGLDGAGIESLWRWDFPHPSKPALGPTQTPIQWVQGFSWG